MATSRQEQIEEIIKSRKPLADDIERKQKTLEGLSAAIGRLKDLHDQILKDGSHSMIENLKDIQLEFLQQKIESEKKALDKPKSRFTRETLNIGVIGRTGQGKSRLLQSLSGLTSKVIPTGSGGFCTGVRSLILNDNDANKTGGEIHFYSQGELLYDVLAPYYIRLNLNHGNPPNSIENFANQPLPKLDGAVNPYLSPLENPKGPGYISSGEMYRHLQEYRKHIQSYRTLIGSEALPIPIAQVREFVAQDSPDGNTKYYNHLAVKEAKIMCKFPSEDVEKIALVDMPGLGDTGVGDDMRLLQALEEYIDIVLFIMMPSPKRGVLSDVDFGLYDVAYHALNGIPIKEWSFMVLNHIDSPNKEDNNYDNCERIKRQIDLHETGIEGRRIEVIQCIIANCIEPKEAQEKVLEVILKHLEKDMPRLDRIYMSSWVNRCAELKKTTSDKVKRLSSSSAPTVDEERIFSEHFPPVWEHLTSSVEALLKTLRAESNQANPIFAEYFTTTFHNCLNDTGLPETKERLEKIKEAKENYTRVFVDELVYARTHLTHHFIDMDAKLNVRMDGVKEEIARIFLGKDGGELENLLGTPLPGQFFQVMLQPDMLSLHSHLYKTFSFFDTSQISLRGFFQSIIRTRGFLNNLRPDIAVPNFLLPRFASNRLNRLRQQMPGLDPKVMEALVDITLKFLNQMSGASSLTILLENLLQTIANIDPNTRKKLTQHMKTLFIDESQQVLVEYEPGEVLQALKDAHKKTVENLQNHLKEYLSEPGKATLAIVEEFIDQAFRSRTARDEWEFFYRTHKQAIWSSEYGQTIKWQGYLQQWQAQVQKVEDVLSAL